MELAQSHFVVSNFNTDPNQILKYCENFTVYDQSHTPFPVVGGIRGVNVIHARHVGHNLGDYFDFIISHWDALPSVITFTKGNMIGRHVSQAYFDRVYLNNYYTFLYSDNDYSDSKFVSGVLFESSFLEINNSWYLMSRPSKYFDTYNQALNFIFHTPNLPDWLNFCPGACMIVERERITKYPRDFYRALQFLVTYDFFPGDAFIVERMLHTIYFGNLELKNYMCDFSKFLAELEKYNSSGPTFLKRSPLRRIAAKFFSYGARWS